MNMIELECGECGTVDETFPNSPCHVLKLCHSCWAKKLKSKVYESE